jgi:hypothetical protein
VSAIKTADTYTISDIKTSLILAVYNIQPSAERRKPPLKLNRANHSAAFFIKLSGCKNFYSTA